MLIIIIFLYCIISHWSVETAKDGTFYIFASWNLFTMKAIADNNTDTDVNGFFSISEMKWVIIAIHLAVLLI